jgi:SAM-dependent methyltransferase
MKNPWLEIELSDYENHMALPGIEQAQYLSEFFGRILERYKPESTVILGCAGGNGLEKIDNTFCKRVICVDINQEYLDEAERRFKDAFHEIEFICEDIASHNFKMYETELIFAGLVFEYVELETAVRNIGNSLKSGGILAAVIQLPSDDIPEVSPSPYKSLEKLGTLFSFVKIDDLIKLGRHHKMEIISKEEILLKSGKKFAELIFKKC